MDFLEQKLSVDSASIQVRSWGDESGEKLLALHGWLDNRSSFDGLAPHLSDFHCVAIDFPGHGQSDWLAPNATYHYLDNVALVDRIRAALGWERFTLMGHSMGAGISSLYAGACPDRVERLILFEGIGPLTNPEEMARDQMFRSMHWKGGSGRRVYASLEEAAERRVGGPAQLGVEAARTLTRSGSEPCDGGVRFSHDPRLRAPSRMRLTQAMTLTYLEKIACPTLYIQALQGWPLPQDMLAKRWAAVSNFQLCQVEGNHHVHLEHPERVIEPVRALLATPGKIANTLPKKKEGDP